MKIKNNFKRWRTHWVLLGLIMLSLTQCKKESVKQEASYDPSKPVAVTDFTPKEGAAGSNLVIYGDNFGNDLSKIVVTIGGKEAKVIGVKNNSLYCIVPAGAYDGDIHVSILGDNDEELAQTQATEIFAYTKKMLVSTFLGTYYEVGSDYVDKEGPFNDCGAFKGILWFSFDPKNHDHLYFTSSDGSINYKTRLIDFDQRYVSYFKTNLKKMTSMTWRIDGDQDMVVADDQEKETHAGCYTYSRSSNFKQNEPFDMNAVGEMNGNITSIAVHPKNGELYYFRYRGGDLVRYDFQTKEVRSALTASTSKTAFYIVIHPSGDYAYLIGRDQNYILRTDYDYAKKTFTTPYTVCGEYNKAGYADGIGTNARLNYPSQGVFVKNPDYEATGGDQYDFYFCDGKNHAVRTLTPQGRVGTFAGRGNNGDKGYADGDLRTEARFNLPQAIAYDEERKCFYIGDSGNWLIRKIAKEE
ncbi:MAG TPA: IPT/TIG domain-containing protein [Pelobium sp.]|nr:IPT/TIG domain-containing protein [Pelobium sp.]